MDANNVINTNLQYKILHFIVNKDSYESVRKSYREGLEASLLRPEVFIDHQARQLFQIFTKSNDEAEALAEIKRNNLGAIYSNVITGMDSEGNMMSPDFQNFRKYIAELNYVFDKSKIWKLADRLKTALKQDNGLQRATELLEEANQGLKAPIKANNSMLEKLLTIQNELSERRKQNIQFAKPLAYYNGDVPVLFPHTITALQGKKGSHKSRVAETLISMLLSDKSICNISRNEAYNPVVALIDTERNVKDQLPFALKSIVERAGTSDGLHYTSLIEIPRAKRIKAIQEFLKHIQEQNEGKHIVVVIDVLTDLIGSFNDLTETMILTDYINSMISQFETSFIVVIHENPSQETTKARGHTGTELINKASTSLKVGYVKGSSEIIELKFLHTRSIKEPEPIYLKYDDGEKGLVEADGYTPPAPTNKIDHSDIYQYLKNQIETSGADIELKAGLKLVSEKFGIAERTASRYLTEITNGGNNLILISDDNDKRRRLLTMDNDKF